MSRRIVVLVAVLAALLCAPSPGRAADPVVNAGDYYSCGLRADSTLQCWGQNVDSFTWTPPAGTFASVASYKDTACALTGAGAMTCWGGDQYGTLTLAPTADPYTQVAAGWWHMCALTTTQDARCWGRNANGEVKPGAGTGNVLATTTGPFKSIIGGNGHTCAIRTDGTVTCWGNNGDGQAPAAGPAPDPPTDPSPYHFSKLAAGNGWTCGILDEPGTPAIDDTVRCWGLDWTHGQGQSGVPAGVKFSDLSAGQDHTCGLDDTGTARCWGNNAQGAVGGIPAGAQFKSISAGTSYTCGVKSDDTVACWGRSVNGQGVPLMTSAATTTGTVGTPFTFTVTTTPQAPPPTLSRSAGAFPPGLTLGAGGVLSGTPTRAGTYTATLTAANGLTPDATQGLQVTIAAAAPTVSGTSADGVTPSAATLHGTVAPGGADTTYHFEYGPTTGYGSSTTTETLLAGLAGEPVSAALSGLTPGTTYHYRLVATNSATTTTGTDGTFTTTGGAAPTPTPPADPTPTPAPPSPTPTPAPPGALDANVRTKRLTAGSGNRVRLDARDSVAPGTTIVAYRWTVDGKVISTKPTVTLEVEARTVVELQVTDAHGRTATTRLTLRPRAPKTVVRTLTVHFCGGCSGLSDRSRAAVRRLRARAAGATRVEISGYADDAGSSTFNWAVSRRRAVAVQATLLNGLRPKPERVVVRAFGEAAPVRSNTTPTGRAANRRVTIRITRIE